MDNRLLPVGLVFVLVFALIPSITFAVASALPLAASPNPFTLSNTIINVGQYSTTNTLVSGGSGGPYSAQWTWINSNEVNNQVINTITVGSAPHGVSFNPSGTLAYVTNVGSDTVNVIQVSSNSVINTITVGIDPYGVSFNPSGTLAYVANYNSDTVNVIQVSSNSVINTITVGIDPYGLAFNPSGTLAYVTNYNSDTVNVIQVSSNSVINTITVGSDPASVAFNPSSTLAYVANYGSNTVNVIQVSSNSVINTITVGTNPVSLSFNPSGTLAYVANYGSNTVNVIQVSSNSVINTITVGTNPVSLSFNPSGTLAYVINYNGDTVSVIGDLPETSLQEVPSSGLMQLSAHAVNGNTLAFTFNGVTYTESTGQNTIYGAWTLYGFVQDNGTDIYYYGSNTILLSNTLTIDPALSTPTISPSNPTIDNGQSVSFTSSWSGGTTDYTAKLYSSTTSTCNTGSTLVQTLSSLTSGSASFSSTSPTSTTYYCIFVTDGATTPETTNSINSEVVVNSALGTPSISPSNPTIDNGQSVSFTSSWSGGTPTYGASLYASPTSACNQQSTLVQQDIALSANTVTFSQVTPSANTYYCIFVTDNTLNSYSLSTSITSGFSQPQGVAFSPSGTYAYVTNCNSNCFGSGPDNVVIINTASNTVTGSITSGFNEPYGVAFSPSGTYAYVTSFRNNNAVIINTATNTVTGSIASGFEEPISVAFSPSGTYAYVTNFASENIAIINTATNTVTGSITSGFGDPQGVAFSPSGTYAYVTNCNSNCFGSVPNNVVIINTASNTVTGSITSGFNEPYGVAFSPSGTYAYVTNLGNNVVIINTASNTVTGSITSGFNKPYGVAFSPSGTYAYVTNYNYDNVLIINTGTSTTNSIYSLVSINPTLSVPTISPSNKIINSGQSVTFSSTWTGGTPDYTAKLYSSSSSTCNTGSALVQSIPSLTTGSTAFNPVTPASTTYYCIFITDSASTPVTVNSTNGEVIVNTGPQVSNPYAGGPTGYFGPNSTLSSSTTSTITSSSTTILPVTTITPITASPGTKDICNDSSGYTINYPSLNATIKVAPAINGCFRINIINATSQSRVSNNSVITAINYTVNNTNVSADMILHYSCSIPNSDVAPFILRNGTWQEITPFTLNATACTVEFAIPSDPVIALLNTNVTSTINTTAATTTAQTPVTTAPAPQQNNSPVLILILVILVIIVIAVLFIYLRNRR